MTHAVMPVDGSPVVPPRAVVRSSHQVGVDWLGTAHQRALWDPLDSRRPVRRTAHRWPLTPIDDSLSASVY